ncbi:hypothetical protein HPB48_019155 [Haemaphysalis longicornis]|uniref:Uncharacterized protein n=1 Tax=Haemaphysalis longicornis TaxID=44386 RepID=A0A9J6G2T1_HAELO|nr:hypothetical protein HPB48_019155 [Haemaphysalis longicornis]
MPEQARAPAASAGDHGGAEATSAVVASAPGDASTSQQVIGAALRLVTTVTGESISQEEYEDDTGWLQCYGRKHGRTSPRHPMDASDALSADHRSAHSATQASHEAKAQHQNRPIQRPRFPRLPKDDIKAVIPPRDGLNVARISEATLRDSILRAAGLEQELASTDIFRANQTQNILVISTALLERAVRYTRIEQIKIGETTYATRAYLPPVDSSSQKNNNEKSSKPPRHSRSKSKKRNPDSAETAPLRQPCSTGTPDCTTQVSWSAKASQTARAGAQTQGIDIRAKQDNEQEELQSIRATLDQVLAENRHLKAELAQIKRSCTPATSSAGTPASHSFEENRPRSKRRAEEAADRPSQERHQMEQLEQRFKQGFEELQCAVNSLATALANFRETIHLKVTALEFKVAQLPSACTSSPTPPQQVGPIRSFLFPRGHGAPPYAEAVQLSAVQTASDHHGARTR